MNHPDVRELNEMLLDAFPSLDEEKRRIALAIYRLLARGEPVPAVAIAAKTGLSTERVESILSEWIGVYRDEDGRIVAFWGLAIPEMKHRFEIEGVRLHTWCAWDTLFLPELIGKTARVESACGTSGEPIRLTVSPRGVEAVAPASPVLSFLMPDPAGFGRDIVTRFCHYIHFFRTRADGEAWTAGNAGTFLLGLDEAVELARLKNRSQFGDLLREGL